MVQQFRRGTVRHVTTRAERSAGRGWVSVAYFSLDGQPARLECEKLPPYGRTPLPPPFQAGDPLVICGRLDTQDGRIDVSCARLIRQGRTIDAAMTFQVLLAGLTFLAMAGAALADIESHASQGGATLYMATVAMLTALLGLLMLGVGALRYRDRRRVEKAA